MSDNKVLIRALRKTAQLPKRAFDTDYALDLHVDLDVDAFIAMNGKIQNITAEQLEYGLYNFVEYSQLLIPANGRMIIPTGIQIALPSHKQLKIGENIYTLRMAAEILPRSGNSIRHGLMVANSPGTIDADYRGEIGVIVYNASSFDYLLEQGMRIAQLAVKTVLEPPIEFLTYESEPLPETKRNAGGFGHTGEK